MACQREERVEHASGIRTQRHRRSKGDLPGSIRRGLLEGLLPRPRDVDAESPRVGRVRFLAAKNAGVLVVRTIVSMCVNRGRARLQPHARRTRRPRDRLSDDARRPHARLQDLLSMSGGVSAVDAPAGQIDDDVASIDLALPAAERRSVPRNHAPWPGARRGGSGRRRHHRVRETPGPESSRLVRILLE